jgi:hypothetical protein
MSPFLRTSSFVSHNSVVEKLAKGFYGPDGAREPENSKNEHRRTQTHKHPLE